MTQVLPAHIDPDFADTVVAVSDALGMADPLCITALLFSESGINPTVENSIGCVGINQFCGSTARAMGITDKEAYKRLTASEQLSGYVFPFWKSLVDAHHVPTPVSGRDLYWLNFLPATYVPNAPDSHVITSDPGIVEANPGFAGGKGFITAGDVGNALQEATAGSSRYAEIAALVRQAEGRSTQGSSLLGIVILLGALSATASYFFFPAQTLHTAHVLKTQIMGGYTWARGLIR